MEKTNDNNGITIAIQGKGWDPVDLLNIKIALNRATAEVVNNATTRIVESAEEAEYLVVCKKKTPGIVDIFSQTAGKTNKPSIGLIRFKVDWRPRNEAGKAIHRIIARHSQGKLRQNTPKA